MTRFKCLITNNLRFILQVLDIGVTTLSFLLALVLTGIVSEDKIPLSSEYLLLYAIIIPTWGVLIKTTNLTQVPRSRTYLSIFFNIIRFNLIGLLFLFALNYVVNFSHISTSFIFVFFILTCTSLIVVRLTTYKFFKVFRASGFNIHQVALIADKESEELIDSILDHREWGYKIAVIFSDSQFIKDTYSSLIQVLPENTNIKDYLKSEVIDEVLLCKKNVDLEHTNILVSICKELGVTFKVKAKVGEFDYPETQLTHLEKTPFLTFLNTPNGSLSWAWKSISDFIIAAILLFFTAPFLLLIALGLKLDSKGPVIFKQQRIGLHGRKFYIYKFRTMVSNAEELKAKLEAQNESDGPTFKIKNDPRITSIGRFLRKTSIDELPQLLNVLNGEMSLIGPRPPLAREVMEYEDWQLRRLSVKPGITCTWQIIPNRNDVVFENWMKLDIEYIDKWSIKSDWSLFFKTIKSVLVNKGY